MPLPRTIFRRTGAVRSLAPFAAAALSMALSACASEGQFTGYQDRTDYRQNHPIVLTHGDRTIDVLAAGGPGGIGARQIADIRAFAHEYRRNGRGPLLIATPTGHPEAAAIVPAIRTALSQSGVPGAVATAYQPVDPGGIAPVKLSFVRLKAEVATECGRWADDLSGSQALSGLRNEPYENFGCAYQNMLAQQVADPLDLVRGRPEGTPSAVRSATVLKKFGAGQPTAVVYPDEGRNKIGNVGQ
jgi:pilus assembly protein CpaD